jgi:hypothetical protein
MFKIPETVSQDLLVIHQLLGSSRDSITQEKLPEPNEDEDIGSSDSEAEVVAEQPDSVRDREVISYVHQAH